MKKTLLNSALALVALSANAQYISEAPAGGFDLNKGKDYVVLYAPEDIVGKMGDKLIQNNNLDPEMVDNQFYYWTHDWAKDELQLLNVEEDNPVNSWGGSDVLNMTPLDSWGGGGFAAKAKAYDLSKVTDQHIVHIGLRDFGNDAGKTYFQFRFGPLAKIKSNGFMIAANCGVGDEHGDFAGVGKVGHDGKWYYLDIPVADLVDPNGNYGFSYDFSQPINDHVFCVSFDGATVSKTDGGVKEPGATVRTYTIQELGTALSIDAIFFYAKDDTTPDGITVVSQDPSTAVRTYNLSGQQVGSGYRGVVIKNGRKYVQ